MDYDCDNCEFYNDDQTCEYCHNSRRPIRKIISETDNNYEPNNEHS